tara:strand:- start:195 stop:908 length:714 start_codon:yes stop_codon:yes gene_type:complete
MALPKLNTPTYELEVPSTDEKIKYRPFLVKEEKILLMAMESKDNAQIINAVKDIVSSCTFEKVNVSTMPMFDMEYIFLNIRAKSVGEISKLKILCPDDKKTYASVELDLTKVEVQVSDDHTNKIELTDDMGMIMTYPTIDSFLESGIENIDANNMLDVIGSCVLQIYEEKGEKVYQAKDQTKKELTEFIESMNSGQFKQLQSFFDTMPKLTHTIKVKNPKTKKTSDVKLTGLNDFFA